VNPVELRLVILSFAFDADAQTEFRKEATAARRLFSSQLRSNASEMQIFLLIEQNSKFRLRSR